MRERSDSRGAVADGLSPSTQGATDPGWLTFDLTMLGSDEAMPGPKIARPENANQARLLRLLRNEGRRSRAELGDDTGLARSTLTLELSRLEELGFIQEDGPAKSRGGRRSRMVTVRPELRFVGVDLGVTSIDVAATDAELNVRAHVSEPAEIRKGPKVILRRVDEIIAKLLSDEGAQPGEQGSVVLAGIGVGVPGPVRFTDGVPVSPPIMPGWNAFPVRDYFAREYGCPVIVDNDVNVMAAGELWGGVGRSIENFMFVKIGTGIGCGIVIRGEVYRGVDGCAGDIGHVNIDPDGPVCACGNAGCLESLFGGTALVRDATAAARTGGSALLAARLEETGTLSSADVGNAAAEGDPASVGLIRQGGRRVGLVLATLVSCLNPSLIVIGGGLAELGHVLLAEIRGVVYRRSLPLATGNLPIVRSELGDRAGVLGAVAMASDHLFSVP